MTWMNCQILLTVCSLYQQAFQLFEANHINQSTLWVGNRGDTWIPEMQVQEHGSDVIITATIPQLDTDRLEIRVTSETVLLQGILLPPTVCQSYLDFEFCLGQFQTLIPLPVVVEPQSAIAHVAGDLLMITLARAWKGRRGVKVPIEVTAHAADDFAFSAFNRGNSNLVTES